MPTNQDPIYGKIAPLPCGFPSKEKAKGNITTGCGEPAAL